MGRSGEWPAKPQDSANGGRTTIMGHEVNWVSHLDGLHGRRRAAVIAALQSSADQGYPASADGIRELVAYALGQISARQYSARMLESLGFVPAPRLARKTADFEPLPDLATWRNDERRSSAWIQPQPRSTGPSPATKPSLRSQILSREEAVRAFMSGRIPVDEFLRLSRVRTA